MAKFSLSSYSSSTQDHRSLTKKLRDGFGCVAKVGCFLALVFGISFVYLYFAVYVQRYFTKDGYGEISIRHFSNDLNTKMCSAYKIHSDEPANVYLVSGKAGIDPNKQIIRRKDGELYPKNAFRDNTFYLLEGSHIKVNVCKIRDEDDTEIDILILKGEKSWDKWDRGECDSCPIKKETVKSGQYCDNGGRSLLDFHVQDRDTYITVVTKRNGYYVEYLKVKADLEILQTVFDTSHPLQMCSMTKHCVLNLTYALDVDVVMKFSNATSVNSFSSRCRLRVVFWVGIFSVMPVSLILLMMSFCCVYNCMEHNTKKGHFTQGTYDDANVRTNDTNTLVENEVPPEQHPPETQGRIM